MYIEVVLTTTVVVTTKTGESEGRPKSITPCLRILSPLAPTRERDMQTKNQTKELVYNDEGSSTGPDMKSKGIGKGDD